MNKKGFTLIELIVVIAVLGILVLLATPKFLGHKKDASIATMETDIKTLENTVAIYHLENGEYPTSEDYRELPLDLGVGIGLNEKKVEPYIQNLKNNVEDYSLTANGLVLHQGGVLHKDGSTRHYYKNLSPNKVDNFGTINTMTIAFDESLMRSQMKTVNIPDLEKILSVTIDNGEVEYSLDNELTINVSNGDIYNVVDNPTKYSKEVSKSIEQTSNSFPAEITFDDGEYVGSINKAGSVSSESRVTGSRWVDTGYWSSEPSGSECISWFDDRPGDYGAYCEEWRLVYRDVWVDTGGYHQDTYTRYYTQNYSGVAYKAGIDNYYQYEVTVEYISK